jgi:MoaA/NifB/PqqE/SkfB family radical SAM enzyme
VATNGLNLLPYLDDVKRINVSHVTVTVNAVDPVIGARIYSWMRVGKRVIRAEEGAAVLLERQFAAIKGLKDRGIMVKANSIILPGINEDHIEAVARGWPTLGWICSMPCHTTPMPAPNSSISPNRTRPRLNGSGCIRGACQADAPLHALSCRCRRPAGRVH